MKIWIRDGKQTVQRVKVGVIGLASVLLLIGVAAVIFSAVDRERPVVAIGAPKEDVVANLTMTNSATSENVATSEPLAELGVAPSTQATPAASAAGRP
ncbi:hypothetical protein [uncultured Sphingomonas sp.]|uniref:hypothetical protein n=1 Tax=uncultured Sphingomonas sp. TaxID=158754 RepID=UPI0035CA6B4C